MTNIKKDCTIENEAIIQESKVDYISAKEALKIAKKKQKLWVNMEEIFQKIQESAEKGYQNAEFWNAKITAGQYDILRKLGYTIEVKLFELDTPYFVVYW